jgi:predicted dehydrogenase
MSDIINWGILSTARINRSLIAGVRASKRSRLAAVASRELPKGQEFAQNWNIPMAYGSYEALLADPHVDIIYIPLPNHLHASWTIKALEAGKHVLVEKPIALSISDVRAIQQAARKSGKFVAEAFMYRHHPQTLKVQELVAAGEIGAVYFIEGTFSFSLDRLADIRWNPEYGGGSIWDIGCYPLSYTRMITGRLPIAVQGAQVQTSSEVDLTFSGQLQYSDGLLAQFHSSFGLPNRTHMVIQGATGILEIPSPFKPQDPTVPLILRREDGQKEFHFPECELYLGEVEDMENAILDGRQTRLTLQESEDNIATIIALLESAKTGQVVRL